MGLYDAVEKTTMKGDESRIIYNVDHILPCCKGICLQAPALKKAEYFQFAF